MKFELPYGVVGEEGRASEHSKARNRCCVRRVPIQEVVWKVGEASSGGEAGDQWRGREGGTPFSGRTGKST